MDSKPTREDGIRLIAQSCTRRMMELELPDKYALLARDVIVAHLENYHDRLMAGEWEQR